MHPYLRTLIVLGVLALAVAPAGATTTVKRAPSIQRTAAAPVKAAKQRKASHARAADEGTVGTAQSPDPAAVADYWTPERMKNAQPDPMGARPGGATVKQTAQGSAAGGKASAAAKSTKRASKSDATPSKAVSSTVDPAQVTAYWTAEQMANAQPLPTGVSGGQTSAPPASGGSAGGTAP